jgi:hypothetical protein
MEIAIACCVPEIVFQLQAPDWELISIISPGLATQSGADSPQQLHEPNRKY